MKSLNFIRRIRYRCFFNIKVNMSSYVRHTEHFLFGLGEFQFRSNVQAGTSREAVAGVLNILFGKIISESLVHRDLRSTAEEKVSCELFLE